MGGWGGARTPRKERGEGRREASIVITPTLFSFPSFPQLSFWLPDGSRLAYYGNTFFNLSSRLPPAPGGAPRYVVTLRDPAPPAVRQLPAGTLVAVSPRLGIMAGTGLPGGRAYLVTNGTAVTTEDVNVLGAASEAVVEAGGLGGNVYRRIAVTRPGAESGAPQPYLLSANADGFHSSEVVRGPTLVDSTIAYTCDDILNIHGKVDLVLGAAADGRSLLVLDIVGSSSPGDFAPSTFTYGDPALLPAGSELRLWAPPGPAAVPAKQGGLLRVAVAGGGGLCTSAACAALAAAAPARFAAQGAPIGHPVGGRVVRVQLQAPLAPALLARVNGSAFLVDAPARGPAGGAVSGNTFHDSYGHCGLFRSSGATVENNTCRYTLGPMIVGASGTTWLEGPMLVSNVTLRDNTFRGLNGVHDAAGCITPVGGGHTTGIVVEGTTWEGSSGEEG